MRPISFTATTFNGRVIELTDGSVNLPANSAKPLMPIRTLILFTPSATSLIAGTLVMRCKRPQLLPIAQAYVLNFLFQSRVQFSVYSIRASTKSGRANLMDDMSDFLLFYQHGFSTYMLSTYID